MDLSASLAPCHKHHLHPKSVKNKDGKESSVPQCLHQPLLIHKLQPIRSVNQLKIKTDKEGYGSISISGSLS